MTRRPRRNHTAVYKAKVALAELSKQFDGMRPGKSILSRDFGR